MDTKGVLAGWVALATTLCGMAGENLLRDDFADDNAGGFVGWSVRTGSSSNVKVDVARLEPDSQDVPSAVRIAGEPFGKCVCEYLFHTAFELPLVKGGRYRLSAQVRAHGLDKNIRTLRFVVAEGPWNGGNGVQNLPGDTHGEWVDVSWEGVLDKPSKNGRYVCVVYALSGVEGFPEGAWLDIRSPRLEGPVSNGRFLDAVRNLRPFPIRITPVDPLLSEMRSDGAEMLFYCPAAAASVKGERKLLRATMAGRNVSVPFGADGRAKAVFGPMSAGKTNLHVDLVGAETGKVYAKHDYRAYVRDDVKGVTPLKRLNNFVSELFCRPYSAGDSEFTLAKDSWLYVSLSDAGAKVECALDGEPARFVLEAGKLELMRRVGPGRHVLSLKGKASGNVTVRVVKCIYRSALHRAAKMNPNFTDYYYGEDFFNAFGLFGGMNATSVHSDKWNDPATLRLVERMRDRGVQVNWSYGLGQIDSRRDSLDGYLAYVTQQPSYKAGELGQFDENGIALGNGSRSKVNSAEVWWQAYKDGRLIDVFFYDGAMSVHRYPHLDIPELSAYANSGDGRSMMLAEVYYRSPETQADFDGIVDFAKLQFRTMGELVPSAPSRFFYLFNGWMMIGGFTSWYSTGTDMRAFNAEMLRIFATDPAFAEMGGAAFSTPACREDFFRFIVAALRYYCIDGNTDSFAAKNGMSVWPRHVRNGDFLDGLDGWTVEQASPGGVSVGYMPDFGSKWQSRQYPSIYTVPAEKRPGNSFAVFTQSTKGPNTLRQKITGLEPGRVYQLTCAISDLATAKKGITEGTYRKVKPVNLPFLRVEVEGADEIPELRHVYDDLGKYGRQCVFPTRVVFRAKSSEAEAVFCDWKADGTPGVPQGRQTVVNYIGVYPYFYQGEEQLEQLKSFTKSAREMDKPADGPIGIDVGRQLFVDDFLVGSTKGVVRRWNKPVKVEQPIVWPGAGAAPKKVDGTASTNEAVNLTCATDGGLWWDPVRRKFRLWYNADWLGDICYAESKDGIAWEYPDLGIAPGTNRIFEHDVIDSWCVVPNYAAENPYADWKLHISSPFNGSGDRLWTSADGIHFRELGLAGRSGDRSTMYFDPFRGKWVFSLRDYRKGFGRFRRRFTSRVFGGENCRWSWRGIGNGTDPETHKGLAEPEEWLTSSNRGRRELYSFNAVAYESVMLGVMEMLYNTRNDNRDCEIAGLPKDTRLHFCFSRDGLTFEPRDEADISPEGWGSGSWDSGYLSPIGGICVVKDERLWFYYSGLRGDATRNNTGKRWWRNGMYSNGAIGAATLRRDGFAGMVADGMGEIATKPITFSGKHLFVNADCRFGSLKAEFIGRDGRPIPGFSSEDCIVFSHADSTKTELAFNGGDLSALAGKPVRLRFFIHCGSLYSFWVSPSVRGESRGYVAAGGPDYAGLRDL